MSWASTSRWTAIVVNSYGQLSYSFRFYGPSDKREAFKYARLHCLARHWTVIAIVPGDHFPFGVRHGK
jgi:hypothetical protein